MSSFEKRINDNLASMGAPAEEWSAVTVLSMESIDVGQGRQKEAPVFEFPQGYTEAPSAYKGQERCCNLCGADIKNYYWIQNDAKKWVMPVGSECVTRFGQGLSGEVLAKATVRDANRALLAEAVDARKLLWATFAKVSHLGYGRTEKAIPRTEWVAGSLYAALKEITGKRDPADAPDGVVTRWAKSHGERAKGLIEEARVKCGLAAAPEGTEASTARRRTELGRSL